MHDQLDATERQVPRIVASPAALALALAVVERAVDRHRPAMERAGVVMARAVERRRSARVGRRRDRRGRVAGRRSTGRTRARAPGRPARSTDDPDPDLAAPQRGSQRARSVPS